MKKPDTSTDPMKETRMFGELFDYMMFLKSTYNLTQIFGVLTCYSDWYVCSLEPEPASSQLKSLLCSCNMETFELFSPEEPELLDQLTSFGASSSSSSSSFSSSFTFTEEAMNPVLKKQCTLSQSLHQMCSLLQNR